MITCPENDIASLLQGAVHVWTISLDDWHLHEGPLTDCLCPEEAARAARFSRKQDYRMYVISHGVLRHILSFYLDVAPNAHRFRMGPAGKPYLARTGTPDVFFNLSHSGSMALVAVALVEVGVDVEKIRSNLDWQDLSKLVFSHAERQELMAFHENDRVRAFFTGWSRKEAFIKAIGGGLSIPLDSFSVSLEPGRTGIKDISLHKEAKSCWSMHDLDVGSDYSASIVLKAEACRCSVVRSCPRILPTHK